MLSLGAEGGVGGLRSFWCATMSGAGASAGAAGAAGAGAAAPAGGAVPAGAVARIQLPSAERASRDTDTFDGNVDTCGWIVGCPQIRATAHVVLLAARVATVARRRLQPRKLASTATLDALVDATQVAELRSRIA